MRLKALFAVGLVLLLSGCSRVDLELANGSSVALSDFQGQWLLINYWAQWCKPCIEEIPELNEVDAQQNVSVLGYNFDRHRGDALAEQATRLGIQFPLMVHDPAPLFEQEPPSALPATMVIDPQGEFRQWLMGPQSREGINSLLSEYERQ